MLFFLNDSKRNNNGHYFLNFGHQCNNSPEEKITPKAHADSTLIDMESTGVVNKDSPNRKIPKGIASRLARFSSDVKKPFKKACKKSMK